MVQSHLDVSFAYQMFKIKNKKMSQKDTAVRNLKQIEIKFALPPYLWGFESRINHCENFFKLEALLCVHYL